MVPFWPFHFSRVVNLRALTRNSRWGFPIDVKVQYPITPDDSYDWIFISKGSIWHFLRQPSEKKVAAGFPCYDVTPYLTDAFYKGLRMRVRLTCNCVFFAQLSGINITKKSLVLMFEKIKHQCSGVKKNKITISLEEIFQLSLFTNK